jgi:hypothetical protein
MQLNKIGLVAFALLQMPQAIFFCQRFKVKFDLRLYWENPLIFALTASDQRIKARRNDGQLVFADCKWKLLMSSIAR